MHCFTTQVVSVYTAVLCLIRLLACCRNDAHLRVMDLYFLKEWVLAGVDIRRPHDVLRHRQARRHCVLKPRSPVLPAEQRTALRLPGTAHCYIDRESCAQDIDFYPQQTTCT